jgi:hypothetical protein
VPLAGKTGPFCRIIKKIGIVGVKGGALAKNADGKKHYQAEKQKYLRGIHGN